MATLELISQTILGEGTPDYNLETGVFNPNVPGIYVFKYVNPISGSDLDCNICQDETTLTINVNPIPGPGTAFERSVCNDGACNVDIFNEAFITSQAEVGTLTYEGYSNNSSVAPSVPGGGWGGTQPLPTEGDVVASTLNFGGAAAGFYFFKNTVTKNGCTHSTTTIIQVVADGNAGTAGSALDYCNDADVSIVLRDQLTAEDAGGYWQVTSGNPTTAVSSGDPGLFISGENAVFNPLNQIVGTYEITYVASTPAAIFPLLNGCGACTAGSATITINITESVDAGEGASNAVC